ncbi:hypothetical protein PIB30_095417, partial [Stylosanthes scabra]|nr:hypothetical protein [Stylosanthes scabra]
MSCPLHVQCSFCPRSLVVTPSTPPSSFVAAPLTPSHSLASLQSVVGAFLRQPFGALRRRVSPYLEHPSLSSSRVSHSFQVCASSSGLLPFNKSH